MEKAWLASQELSVRFVYGFGSSRKGWMPFFGDTGLLSMLAGRDGLFVTQQEAQHAGEEFQRQYRRETVGGKFDALTVLASKR
ncbi:MAG: hypothetical protein HQL60_07805 [Magnetococcales bacterium]|nr:hypothetical protein [Magnetococcales bacterium]